MALSEGTKIALMYGIPLAVKLFAGGKDEKETVEAVTAAVSGLIKNGTPDVGEALVNASEEEVDGIIEGLFGLITGVAGALGNLIHSLFGLFKFLW